MSKPEDSQYKLMEQQPWRPFQALVQEGLMVASHIRIRYPAGPGSGTSTYHHMYYIVQCMYMYIRMYQTSLVPRMMMSSSGILCRLIIPKQLVTASSRNRTLESVSTIFCSHYHNSYPTAVSPPPQLLFHRWNSNKSTAGSSPTKSDEQLQERHPDAEKEPLPEWPDGVNPHTGERGGPKGPEPTRYGDWERKGRVSDF